MARRRARRARPRAVVSRQTFVRTLAEVSLPPALTAESFEARHATLFRVGPWPAVTIVPPREVCGPRGVVLASLAARATSWLLVRRDAFGELRGLEVEVAPSGRRGEVAVRLLRSSGRSIAEGTARIVDTGVIDFRVRVVGKTRAQRRGRGLVVAGRLQVGRRWRVLPRP
jgi:hypothetical protein